MQTALILGGDQLFGALQVHDVHVVILDVVLQRHGQLGAFGLGDGDEVLDPQRVLHLAAETLGHHAGADALARGVDRASGAGRAAADDQHLVRRLLADLGRSAFDSARVQLGEDFLDRHLAAAPHRAAQEGGGHGHHAARLDLGIVVPPSIRVADVGVVQRHQRQRLHHLGAVVAGQREIGLEIMAAGQGLDLVDHALLHLGRMPAGPQQGQHQRGELMPQRQTGKAHRRMAGRGAGDAEGGHARVLPSKLAVTLSDRAAISLSNSRVWADLASSPTVATSSIGSRSMARYCLSWAVRAASSMVWSFG
jgi:hypothetical protein